MTSDKKCVGELCWNKEIKRLEFVYDKKNCPIEVIEQLKAKTPMIIKEK